MAGFSPFVDINVGIVNEFILNSRGVVSGFGQSVINFFNPGAGLPLNPNDGDRYISLATANGWVINNLEIFDAKTGTWINSVPVSGTISWVDGAAAPVQIWNPITVTWEDLATAIGAMIAPSPTTDNAIARFNGIAGQIQNSGVVLDDLDNITGINDLTVNGKCTVVGLLDPTGLQLTPVAANPGSIPANTLWQNSGTGFLTMGANSVVQIPAAVIPVNTLATFSTGNTLQITPVTIDSLGNAIGLGNVNIAGDVFVGGTINATSTNNLSIQDQFIALNVGYTSPAGTTTGIAMNYAGTGVTTTSNGAFTPAVVATTNATIVTLAAGPLWVAGDIVQVSNSLHNDAFYEVQSHAANILQLRGVGLNPATVEFVRTQLTAETTVGATISGVNVRTFGTNSGGSLITSFGSSSTTINSVTGSLGQSYFISASTTFNIPAGTKIVYCTFWGGGGGGGSNSLNGGGAAGGSSHAVKNYPIPVNGIASLNIVIGAGGTAAFLSAGGVGGNTTITFGSRTIISYGGGGGGLGFGTGFSGGGGGGGGSNGPGTNGNNATAIANGAGGAGGIADVAASTTNHGIYGTPGGAGSAGDNNTIPVPAGSSGAFIGGLSIGGSGGGGGNQGLSAINLAGPGGSMILGFDGTPVPGQFFTAGGGGGFNGQCPTAGSAPANSGAGGIGGNGPFVSFGGSGGVVLTLT